MLLASASICFQGNKCSMWHIKQGSVAGTLSHVMELLLEANKGELSHPQQAFWAMGNGKKGGRVKSERRTEHGWRCRRWWKAQLQSLIASGNRSHFPNHIHEPIIYFHPSLSLPPLPVSLSCSMGCLEFTILLSCRMVRTCQTCILRNMERCDEMRGCQDGVKESEWKWRGEINSKPVG